MEPVAPGTEDDQPVTYSSATKQERERERLLSEKAILPNGRYGNVFEFKYQNGAEHWYCNACACPVMGWVFHHEVGRRHKSTIGITDEDKFNPQPEVEEPVIQIAPGEPVPPGFEGQVEKVAAIQERLDDFHVGPLVALEYLLELKDYDANKEPTYLCVLCDKKGDPRTVLTHLASYKHIQQYLQKHFPTSYRALAPYMTKQYKRNWQEALHKVAEAIEKQFGRLKPMPVDGDKYEKDPCYYLAMVAKGRHFSELSGYTFEELVHKDALTKVHEDEDQFSSINAKKETKKKSPSPPVVANPIKRIKHCSSRDAASSTAVPSAAAVGSRRRSLSSVSSISSSDLSDGNIKSRNSAPREGGGGRRASRSPGKSRQRSRSPGRRFDNRRQHVPRRDSYTRNDRDRESRRGIHQRDDRGLMPWERSNYRRASSKSDSGENKNKLDKIDEYRKLCRAIENDMERVLKVHKKNPEKHPQYNDEWKTFWNRRYKELQAEGKDVSKHDFKPEWIEFWNQRMNDLHQDEIKTKKEALKKRLGLEEPAPISFKIGGSGRKKSEGPKDSPNSKPIPTAAMPDNDPEVIIIEDRDEKSSKRSHSPWEDEPIPIRRKSASKERSTKETVTLLSPVRASRDRLNKDRVSSEKLRERRSRDKQERASRSRRSPSKGNSFERRDRSPKSRDRDRDRYSRSRSRSWDREFSKKPWERDRDRDRERSRPMRGMSDLPPWERSSKRDIPECYKPPSVMRDVTRKPVLSPRLAGASSPPPIEDVDDGGEINVVSVLRLLTALEEKLGSLGPKVIDLLTQALAMEKNEANSSETLLDNEINCVMFETVKEKLKGQLLAGLVDYVQERAFKNAIKKIAGLVHMAGERQKELSKVKAKVDPVKVPGVGTVDKSAIARQIATALVSQGKTDVTQAELEQLINAVVGMAEASRKSNKPITTASFLEQITQKASNPVEVKKEKTPSPPVKLEAPSREASPAPEKPSGPPSMEGLSDSDLQTLLQNFKDLSTEEQHGLINYLKKLEAQEPDRVERLRKFVNLGGGGQQQQLNKQPVAPVPVVPVVPVAPVVPVEKPKGRESPFAKRSDPVNPVKIAPDLPIDSDEEDYSFEDVVKAASNNVKQKELEKKRETELSIDDTKALISNIMSNIKKNDPPTQPPVAPVPPVNLFGLGNSADLAKTLTSLPVDMASLASIVGSVQSFTNTKPVAAPTTSNANIAPKLSFQLPSINYPPASQMTEARLRGDEPLQTYPAQQPARPNFEPKPPQGFPQGFYQGNQQNVQYPQLDKANVAYPNYAMYNRGQGQEQGRFGGGNDQGRFGGGNDQSRFSGGNDQARFGGGNDQGRFGGGNDQARFGGGNDQGRFGQGNDQGRFGGGNEQGRFAGGNDRRGPPNQPSLRGGPGNNRGNYNNNSNRW